MVAGICIPGVVPASGLPGAGTINGAVSVTTTFVTAVFQTHEARKPEHSTLASVPSWSWIWTAIADGNIGSLKVMLNASPGSAKSVVRTLLTMIASVRVGGVTSAGGVVNVAVVGERTSLPATSWISFASGRRTSVYVLAEGNGEFTLTENDESAETGVKPHEFDPMLTTTGSVVAVLSSVSTMSVGSKLNAVQ